MTLTKDQIVKNLNQYKWLFKGDEAYNVMESLVEIMKRRLESGEDIMISGFGKFFVKEKKKRSGRNPHTRESITLDDRTTPLEFAGGFIQGAIACGMNLFWENTLLLTKTVFLFSIHIYFLAWEICPDEDTEAGDKPVEPSQSGPYVLTMVMK